MNRSRWLALVLALLATAAAYRAVAWGGFVYDDLALVPANPSIRSFANVGDWFAHSFWRDVYNPADADPIPYYRPVVTAVLALGHALGGDDPLPYHLLDLALHLAVTALVFALALRFLGDRSGATAGAGVAAFAFGLLPVHTENVCWVSGVSDVVATALGLAAVWCCLRASDLVGIEGRSARAPLLAAGAFLLGLLSFLAKESALAIPFALLAVEFFASERRGGRRFLPWVAFAAAALAYLAARAAVFGPRAGFDLRQTEFLLPEWRLASLRVELFASYVEGLLSPFDLNAFRVLRVDLEPGSPEILRSRIVAVTAIAAAALLAAGAARFRALRVPLGFLVFTFAAILPQIARPQSLGHFVYADRYLYVPSLGLCWLLGAGAAAVGARSAALAWVVAAPLLGAFFWRTAERVPVWRDEPALFGQSAKDSPDCATVHCALGRIHLGRYQRSGDPKDLDTAFERFAATIDPKLRGRVFVSNQDVLQAYLGLASVHMLRSRVDDALSVYEQAIERYPKCEEAHMLSGVALAQLGNYSAAEDAFRRALGLRPNYVEARLNLGNLYLNTSRTSQAALELRRALEIAPGNVEVRLALGTALVAEGRDAEAAEVLAEVPRLAPDHPAVPKIREFLSKPRR